MTHQAGKWIGVMVNVSLLKCLWCPCFMTALDAFCQPANCRNYCIERESSPQWPEMGLSLGSLFSLLWLLLWIFWSSVFMLKKKKATGYFSLYMMKTMHVSWKTLEASRPLKNSTIWLRWFCWTQLLCGLRQTQTEVPTWKQHVLVCTRY